MTVTLGSDLAEVPRLMEAVEAFCSDHGLGEGIAMEMQLVLEEAVTNSMRHGFKDGGDHSVEIRLAVEGRDLVLEVTDDGIPYNPLQRAPVDVDAPLEERTIGGLGIHLVRNVMDKVSYRRQGGRNIITLMKSLDGSDATQDA